MTDFVREVYSGMSVTDRILVLMMKANEMIEFANLMKELGDGPAIKEALAALQNSEKEKEYVYSN